MRIFCYNFFYYRYFILRFRHVASEYFGELTSHRNDWSRVGLSGIGQRSCLSKTAELCLGFTKA